MGDREPKTAIRKNNHMTKEQLTIKKLVDHMGLEAVRQILHDLSPWKDQPIDYVRWVPIEKVESNDYNPNSVAKVEMRLLYVSIEADGYTQPIVAIHDVERDVYVIIDGFHRYSTMKLFKLIADRCNGHLPLVVIDKTLAERMASTVRHNRARGKHSIAGMSSMVFAMLDEGKLDSEICNALGMEPEELIRLKHITGFSKLFADAEYSKAWKTKRQILAEKAYREKQAESVTTTESDR